MNDFFSFSFRFRIYFAFCFLKFIFAYFAALFFSLFAHGSSFHSIYKHILYILGIERGKPRNLKRCALARLGFLHSFCIYKQSKRASIRVRLIVIANQHSSKGRKNKQHPKAIRLIVNMSSENYKDTLVERTARVCCSFVSTILFVCSFRFLFHFICCSLPL